jgi:hypothetical protein
MTISLTHSNVIFLPVISDMTLEIFIEIRVGYSKLIGLIQAMTIIP